MFIDFLTRLISLDHSFAELQINDFNENTRKAICSFCNEFDNNPSIKDAIQPLSFSFKVALEYLTDIANGKKSIGGYTECCRIAEKTEILSDSNPIAATLIAAATYAAWESALGDKLYFQPWEGNHPGWNIFPLILARNAVKAGAIWAPKPILTNAAEFIASAKMASFDPKIKAILVQYRKVLSTIEKKYQSHIANLAWCLRESCKSTTLPNFRAEVAALLWTLGYVPQAHLMKIDNGDSNYVPSFKTLQFVIDQCIKTMPEDILMQYILLEMKDRPPFSMREHNELFRWINIRFNTKPIHQYEEFAPISPSRSYAKVLIKYFSGELDQNREFTENIELYAGISESSDPLITLQMRSLLNLTIITGDHQKENWKYLSDLAINLLTMHNERGNFKNLGRSLDIPFYYLNNSNHENCYEKILYKEYYRSAGIWYWFIVNPQNRPNDNKLAEMLKDEDFLIMELRGAYFIRMLSFLPSHYRRYGFNLDEALNMNAPNGSRKTEDILKFNPFDQELAKQELKLIIEKLYELFKHMKLYANEYASTRENPTISIDSFISLLRKHQN